MSITRLLFLLDIIALRKSFLVGPFSRIPAVYLLQWLEDRVRFQTLAGGSRVTRGR